MVANTGPVVPAFPLVLPLHVDGASTPTALESEPYDSGHDHCAGGLHGTTGAGGKSGAGGGPRSGIPGVSR